MTTAPSAPSVLISGASIAGPALAHWLHHHGYAVTLVERAPAIRPGGQAVDFRGRAHLAMLTRMGVLDDITAMQTGGSELRMVDAAGRTKIALPESFTGGAVEIARGDLAELLYRRTKDTAEYVFGDSIAALDDTPGGVRVTFDSGASRTFDLVIGADGLHSNVRRLAFGPEKSYVRPSGYHIAFFTAPAELATPGVSELYNEPGRGVGIGGEGGRATAMLVFKAPGLAYDRRDAEAQKRLCAETFAGMGWRTNEVLAAMRDAGDFYFDAISLVRMDRYASGRVALIGDAGYGATCGGMGAGMAMIAAYVLAGELAEAGGDHVRAFAAYEDRIRGYAKECQKVAGNAGPFLAPATARGIRIRDAAHRLLVKGPFVRMLERMSRKAAESIDLPDYRRVRPGTRGAGAGMQ